MRTAGTRVMVGARTDWRSRALALAAVLSLLSSALLLVISGASRSQRAEASTADSSVVRSATVTRDHLINNADDMVDTRHVTVHVDATQNLRDRQGISISWSGAHPTGGIIFDNTSSFAAQQEYPVVILQCRGVDSSSAPADQQLSPKTCYTQTPELRYQPPTRGAFPAYRLDRFAAPGERVQAAGAPSPMPKACDTFITGDNAQRWVPFVAADGTSYYGGQAGCAGLAPEQSVLANALSPASNTFGTTATDGTGSATFVVQNAQSNASLGCSDTQACALVVIPIMGISCDAAGSLVPAQDRPTNVPAAQQECGGQGFYQAGANGTQGAADTNVQNTVSGLLWWSASNWRNRITVPITMAQTSAVCDVTGGGVTENVYGSQLLVPVTQQWAPKFCLDSSLFRLQQVQTSEVQAKNLLATGVTNGQYLGVKAAFQAAPPPAKFLNPVVQAPTAITGFSIAYKIDDSNQHEFTELKLNARLLAKLMTMSYPAYPAVRDGWSKDKNYSAISGNPLDVAQDPEFLALNPGAKTQFINQLEGSATLFSISSDSDVISALTSYINSDPEARAWLDGQADPWGMRVNPNYRKIALPVTSWPQLDTYYNPLNNECIQDGHFPILPLIAAPISDPSLVTFNMQYGITNSQINCVVPDGQPDSRDTRRLTGLGRQDVGIRFLIGLVGNGDAIRYGLRTAALQSQKSTSAPVKFSNSTGRTFVQPTAASMLAAAKLFTPDSTLNTWTVPYDSLRTNPAAAQAYPGTMLISTDVPTKGLTSTDAANFGKLLSYAAGPGQVQGSANGQLPEGYVPITTANGLTSMVDYTTRAAAAVTAQNGTVPSVLGGNATPAPPASGATGPAVGGGAGTLTSAGAAGGRGSGSTSGAAAGAGAAAGGGAAGGAGAAGGLAAPKAGTATGGTSSVALQRTGKTVSLSPDWLKFAVPGLALIGLISAAASAVVSGLVRR